jgi:hypothetical protein
VSKRDLKGIRHDAQKFICIFQERVEWRTFVDAKMKVGVNAHVINI